jgi:hypothetical protein
MARRQTERFGITFGTVLAGKGYVWEINGGEESLFPAESIARLGDGRVEMRGDVVAFTTHKGRDRARLAMQRFVSMARDIQDVDDQRCKQSIVAFANEFGTLWSTNSGTAGPSRNTLKNWKREAADYLDMYEVATALQRGQVNALASRFELSGTSTKNRPIVEFIGQSGRWHRVASKGDRAEIDNQDGRDPEIIDYGKIAMHGSPLAKLRMVLARFVNGKLSGGLSFNASATNSMRAIVAPDSLASMLWLRLYLLTVDADGIEREHKCLACGRDLPTNEPGVTRRRKFCDAKCRSRYARGQRPIA